MLRAAFPGLQFPYRQTHLPPDLLHDRSPKIFIGVEEEIIQKYGVYSKECAEAMAKTVQEKLHTDIAVGITGTTGNIDPNNSDSVQGVVYFCIRIKDKVNTFEVHAEVTGLERHEIKQMYTDMVFEKLETLVM